MMSATDAEEALRATNAKERYQRLNRLLICGGGRILKKKFDYFHSPTDLQKKLGDPATRALLKSAKISKPEWDCLYPSPSTFGKSTDFDITLTFRLLRTICNLTPPSTGWNDLPNIADHSLEADLVRIKYFRNNVYGHNKNMEITNSEFCHLWKEISDALLRIAGSISNTKRDEWNTSIDKLLHDPLTPEAQRYVDELQLWYKKDMDVKDYMEQVEDQLQQMNINAKDQQQVTVDIRDQLQQLNVQINQMNQTQVQMNQSPGETAIPLCLRNDLKWDSKSGKCTKTQDGGSSLYLVEEALQKLRNIKGPVCVVAVAGPCRKGKSYILSAAFDQPDVFPLGHEFSPETMGIWMWILPEKHKDSNGQEYSVVLLDSEGLDSAVGGGLDDSTIFTLTVLLSSVLIYNSQGVPTRRDLEGLYYIANLSQGIDMKSNPEAYAGLEDKEIFHKIAPFFIWLLRDVALSLPIDCENIKDYFLRKIFTEEQTSSSSSDQSKKVVRSILSFFPGFDAFALPTPAFYPAVLRSISDNENQLNPDFRSGLKVFRQLLKENLAPKNSFNDDELVSGEGLAQLVELYTKAINTPGAVPNVQNAWDLFVQTKCSDAKKPAMKTYNDYMMSELSPKLPCDSDEIRKCHNAAFAQLESCFVEETAGLLTNTVEECFIQLKTSTDETLEEWYTKNANSTRDSCNAIIETLKKRHLDPVLQQLNGEDAANLSFQDIIDAYDRFKKDYEGYEFGAQDVTAEVFSDLHLKLDDEMEQFMSRLKNLKDYNEKLVQEKAARAFQEQDTQRIKEDLSRHLQEGENRINEMAVLIEKQKTELKRYNQKMKYMADVQQKQLENMKKANEKTLKDKKGIADEKILKLSQERLDAKEENERNLKEVMKMYENENTAPSNGQASFASPNHTSDDRQSASFESDANTRDSRRASFESSNAGDYLPGLLESANASSNAQAIRRIILRTEAARTWQQNSETKQRKLKDIMADLLLRDATRAAAVTVGVVAAVGVGAAVSAGATAVGATVGTATLSAVAITKGCSIM